MLSSIDCRNCESPMVLKPDVYSVRLGCLKCGDIRQTACPHCVTDSIIRLNTDVGPVLACKVCGCRNRELADKECSKKSDLQPGIVMV